MKIAVVAVFIIALLGIGLFVLPQINKQRQQDESQQRILTTPMPNTNASTVNELKIEDIKAGEGQEVESGDTIVINYKGTFLDGKVFDSSYDRGQPFETQIGVGQVIQGWDEGVIGMKVGGKRKLTIPSDMAYGARGVPGIPPNTPLVFELELLNIK